MMMQAARHIAREFAQETKKIPHVWIGSLEMQVDGLMAISIAAESKWTADQIRGGSIGDGDDWMALISKARELQTLPIEIDDRRSDLTALSARLRAACQTKNVRVAFIDYMELIRRSPENQRMSQSEWIPFLGDELKILAKSLGIPIVALRQINKSRDREVSTRPALADLPYDGGQAADAVFAYWREVIDMPEDPPGLVLVKDAEKRAQAKADWEDRRATVRDWAEFFAVKRRFGPLASARMRFIGPRMRVEELMMAVPEPDLLDEFSR